VVIDVYIALMTLSLIAMFWAGYLIGQKHSAVTPPPESKSEPKMVSVQSLYRGRLVWYPVKGEWNSGYIYEQTDPTCQYYTVEPKPRGRGPWPRVARADLRLQGIHPLFEPAPALSLVEFEEEMDKP